MIGGDAMNHYYYSIKNHLKENNYDFVSYCDRLKGCREIAIRTDKNNLKVLMFDNRFSFSRSYISICDYDEFIDMIIRNIITIGQFSEVTVNRGGKCIPEKIE